MEDLYNRIAPMRRETVLPSAGSWGQYGYYYFRHPTKRVGGGVLRGNLISSLWDLQ